MSASKKVWVARISISGQLFITKFYRDEEGITSEDIRRRLNYWIGEEQLDDGSAPIEISVEEKKITSVAISIQEEFGDDT